MRRWPARLRCQLCLESNAALEAIFEKGGKFTPTQGGAITAMHQMSFVLPDAKGAKDKDKDVDEMSRKIGSLILGAGGMEPRTVVLPRPTAVREAATPARPAPAARPVLTVAQMTEEARRLNVSLPLRQQILALAAFAAQPRTGEQVKDREIALMTQLLTDSLELGRAMASNTAITPDARTPMEAQLTEAIALYMDPRTRPWATASWRRCISIAPW